MMTSLLSLCLTRGCEIMDKPIIGVMPLVDTEKDSYWMLPGYMNGISQAGGIPVMLPLTNDENDVTKLASMCDGFLFTGGQDVNPGIYNEEKRAVCGECSDARDIMDTMFFLEALKNDKPCLGICRGLQFFNAVLGGTLYQDLPVDKPSNIIHHQNHPYNKPCHEVRILPGTPLEKLIKKINLPVNSLHHQGIKDLAEGIMPMAFAPDGLIEAICVPTQKFIWAVQWHPEFNFEEDEASRAVFTALIEACRH